MANRQRTVRKVQPKHEQCCVECFSVDELGHFYCPHHGVHSHRKDWKHEEAAGQRSKRVERRSRGRG